MHAAYEQRHVPMRTGRGEAVVSLAPGQLIWGRKAAASQLRMKPKSAENRMLRLVNMGNLARQVATHWTVLTVVNWERYNGHILVDGQATGQPMANQWPTNGQPMATVKEVKKERSEEASSARASLEPVEIPLPGARTAMMMLSQDSTEQQKTAITELLGDVYRDSEGFAVMSAVVLAYNQRARDGDILHPVAYLRTLVDDIGPKVRRESQDLREQAAGEVERDQEAQAREAEQERLRTDPQAFRQAVEVHARRITFYRGAPRGSAPSDEIRAETVPVLCRILGITEPPAGWEGEHNGNDLPE